VTRSHRRRLAALSTLAGLALPAALLAGCSAGQLAETTQLVAAVPGAAGDVAVTPPSQRISIRNATVAFTEGGYPKGGTAPLSLWVVNSTDQPVTLVGVQSDAGQVETCGTAAQPAASTSTTPSASASAGTASPSAGRSGSASPSSSGSARPSGSASTAPSQPPASATTINIPLQPSQILNLTSGSKDGCLQVAGLTRPVSAGLTIGTAFTFQTQDGRTLDIGDSVHPLQVPFGTADQPQPRTSLSLSPGANG
jgi:hypothetical protein